MSLPLFKLVPYLRLLPVPLPIERRVKTRLGCSEPDVGLLVLKHCRGDYRGPGNDCSGTVGNQIVARRRAVVWFGKAKGLGTSVACF